MLLSPVCAQKGATQRLTLSWKTDNLCVFREELALLLGNSFLCPARLLHTVLIFVSLTGN